MISAASFARILRALSQPVMLAYCPSEGNIIIKMHSAHGPRDLVSSFNNVGMQWTVPTKKPLLVAFDKGTAMFVPFVGVIQGTW